MAYKRKSMPEPEVSKPALGKENSQEGQRKPALKFYGGFDLLAAPEDAEKVEASSPDNG